MRIPALEVKQHDKRFYITRLKAVDVADAARVAPDVYSDANPSGYQRPLVKGRARLFGEFIDSARNVSPTSVLLAVREEPQFHPIDGGPLGYLEVHDAVHLYVVDGQHRIEGVRSLMAEGRPVALDLPAIILYHKFLDEADPIFCEAKQFVVINQTQKRVRADLHDRFMAKLTSAQRDELKAAIPTEEAEMVARAISICDKLNGSEDSVWYGMVKTPGPGRRPGVLSQRSFTQSIEKSLLRDPAIKEALDDEELSSAIENWWKAWKEQCPEAFDPETRDSYIIQSQYVPVRVVNWLLQEVLRHFIPVKRACTAPEFRAVIERMSDGNYSEYWSEGGTASKYRGEGGASDLFDLLSPSLIRVLLGK